jgi:nitroreductase
MYSQRTLRRYKPDPVPDELITKLIDAAIRAPSGGNRQPWSFIIIRDAASKQKIGEWYLDAWNRTYGVVPKEAREQFPRTAKRAYGSAEYLANHLAESPVLIMVCAVQPQFPGGEAAVMASHYGSVFPAVQNLLLAARGLGLGAALTTLHKVHEADVKKLLGIPANIESVVLIPVGYPTDKYGPTNRIPAESIMHQERWDASKSGG